jgi:hypothetical protein
MFWIPAAMAAMGAINAQRKQERQESGNRAQAELHKYSPWTGLQGQMDRSYSPSMLEGGLSGGLSGMAATQGLGGAADGTQMAAPATKMNYQGANMLSGQNLAGALGSNYGQGSMWSAIDQPQQPGLYASAGMLGKKSFFGE